MHNVMIGISGTDEFRFGIGEAPSILKEVREAVEGWPTFAKKAKIRSSEASRIKQQLLLL